MSSFRILVDHQDSENFEPLTGNSSDAMNCHFEVAVFLPFGVENNFLFSSCFLHPFFLLLCFLIRFFLIGHETIYQLLSLKGNSLQLILVQFFLCNV